MQRVHIPQNSEWTYDGDDMEVTVDNLQYESN